MRRVLEASFERADWPDLLLNAADYWYTAYKSKPDKNSKAAEAVVEVPNDASPPTTIER